MASDYKSWSLLVGTADNTLILFKVNGPDNGGLVKENEINDKSEVPINSIAVLENKSGKRNFYVTGSANGLIKIWTSDLELVADIHGHSRAINAIVSHDERSVFASVGDDTHINLWEVKVEQDTVQNVELV